MGHRQPVLVALLLALAAGPALGATQGPPAYVYTGTAPSGSCTGTRVWIAADGSGTYYCSSGTWAAASGGGGAPTGAQYWVGAADGTLSAEKNLGALATGLVINTGGTPSIKPTNSCAGGSVMYALDPSGNPSCTSNVPGNAATATALSTTGSSGQFWGWDNTWRTPAGGGGANVVEVDVDFGATYSADVASTVVTGQAWVTATSKIACAPTMLATSSRDEGAEDAVIEGLTVAVHSRVVGTGFTVTAAASQNLGTTGVYKIHCIGG